MRTLGGESIGILEELRGRVHKARVTRVVFKKRRYSHAEKGDGRKWKCLPARQEQSTQGQTNTGSLRFSRVVSVSLASSNADMGETTQDMGETRGIRVVKSNQSTRVTLKEASESSVHSPAKPRVLSKTD